jgi:hypothetical protein
MKPIPKSLHTVTVLSVMACQFKARFADADAAECVESSLEALGYSDTPDAYGLRAAAIAKLSRLPDFKGG